MANELKLSIAMDFLKGVRAANSNDMGLTGLRFTVTGTDFNKQTQNVSLTAEALDIGDTTTPGYIAMKNVSTYDVANYVTIRNGSGGADVVKLWGGDIALFRLATATPFVDATGAVQDIVFLLIEE